MTTKMSLRGGKKPEIRRLILVNHGEPVEKVFGPYWMKFYDENGNVKYNRASATANYVTIEDGNLPIQLLDRQDLKAFERDTPLTEIGKASSQEVGYALGAAGLTADKIGGVIYCSPMCATIESAHFIARGMAIAAAGNQKPTSDEIKLRIENGLMTHLGSDSRINPRNLPKWLSATEIADGLGRQVDTTYVPIVAELATESVDQCYARMKKTTDKLIQSVPSRKERTLLIVGHPATMEGCTRHMYNASPRNQREFDNTCRQIPYCATLRVSERSANRWEMAEPLVPPLTYAANDAFRWEAFGDSGEMKKVLKK